MLLLGLMLDGDFYRDWRTFQWCIYFPALTIMISWALIRWNRKLIILALAIAVVAAYMIIDRLNGDLRFRERARTSAEAFLRSEETGIPNEDPQQKAMRLELLGRAKRRVEFFDSNMEGGIPPYDRTNILAVWFASLFPFVAIAVFYFSAKAKKPSPDALKQA